MGGSSFQQLYSKSQTMEPNIFNLVEDDVGGMKLKVTLYHDSGGVSGGVFLGEIRIQNINNIKEHDAWYFLQPRDNAKTCKTELGSLRLKIDYTSDYVFSSHYYEPLRKLLLSSPDLQVSRDSLSSTNIRQSTHNVVNQHFFWCCAANYLKCCLHFGRDCSE